MSRKDLLCKLQSKSYLPSPCAPFDSWKITFFFFLFWQKIYYIISLWQMVHQIFLIKKLIFILTKKSLFLLSLSWVVDCGSNVDGPPHGKMASMMLFMAQWRWQCSLWQNSIYNASCGEMALTTLLVARWHQQCSLLHNGIDGAPCGNDIEGTPCGNGDKGALVAKRAPVLPWLR